MRDDRIDCPKCGRRMHRGYYLERQHGDRGATTDWVEGAPETSWLTGVKTKGRAVLPVTVYRCEKCGYLESYANPV